MSIAVFLSPMIGTGTRADPFRAKYQRGDASIVRAGSIRFSRIDQALLLMDAAQSYLDTINADTGCIQLATPANIDNAITGPQRNAIETFLENNGIPGGWVATGNPRRQVLRGIAGMFLFAQRMEGRFGVGLKAKMVERGITLETQWKDFPQVLKDEFNEVRDDHKWSAATLGLSNTSTMREILLACGGQFQSVPITLAGLVI